MSDRPPDPIEPVAQVREAESEKSLTELIGDLGTELSTHFQTHLELARTEIRNDVRAAATAGLMASAAGVAAALAALLLSFAAAWGLAEVMAPGWAFLIVGGVWTLAAGALALAGKQRAEQLEPGPRETINEIKEDKRWITNATPTS